MQVFSINWLKLVAWLTPSDLRKVKFLRFAFALIEPLRVAYSYFKIYRTEQLYDARINGQTIKLERACNDVFDPVLRRIYITNGAVLEPPTFYYKYRNRPVVFNPDGTAGNHKFYFSNNNNDALTFNFFVHVPAEVYAEKPRVKALVTKYKIFGRTFDVILIP